LLALEDCLLLHFFSLPSFYCTRYYYCNFKICRVIDRLALETFVRNRIQLLAVLS